MGTSQGGIALIKTLIVVFAVVIIAVVGIALLQPKKNHTSADNGYRRVGDQFMADLTSQNFDKAYNLMSVDLQSEKSEDEWLTSLKDTYESYTADADFFETVKLPSSQAGDEGTDAYQLRYRLSAGKNKFVTYVVARKDQGVWKISDLIDTAPPSTFQLGSTP